MKKIRIGIIGCANIVQRMMGPALKNAERFELVAVASRTRSKADDFAAKLNCAALYDYDELVARDDIDAVYIPLPIGLHEEWSLKALDHGKHVFCEKSLSTDHASVKKIIDRATVRRKVVFENFMFVHHSQIEWMKERIREGAIGDIRCMRSSFGFPLFEAATNIRYKKELGGGVLLDAGSYTVKAASLILGNDFRVKAATLKQSEEYGVDFYGGALLENGQGLFSQIAFGFDNFYQCAIELWGSKGKLTLERAFTAGPGISPKAVIERQNERNEYPLPPDDHFGKILAAFAQAIHNGDAVKEHENILLQSRLVQGVRDAAEKQ